MKEETRQRADNLLATGMLLYGNTNNSEGLKLVVNLWEKALSLYRQIGDDAKLKETEKLLVKLYKNGVKRVRPGMLSESSTSPEAEAPFRDWEVFLKTGCFGFGGPMGVFSLLQEQLVDRKKILTNKDFLEGAVLGDILPGPVTMDIVTYTGYKLRGWLGAVFSTLMFLLPSFILMIILAMFYDTYANISHISTALKFSGAAVTALIISVALKLGQKEIRDYCSAGILVFSFVSSIIFKLNILIVVLGAGIAGILLYVLPSTLRRYSKALVEN
jgi:chromate transporter